MEHTRKAAGDIPGGFFVSELPGQEHTQYAHNSASGQKHQPRAEPLFAPFNQARILPRTLTKRMQHQYLTALL